MEHDAFGAHTRDELGITDHPTARPVQAALASAASFATWAVARLVTAIVVPVASLACDPECGGRKGGRCGNAVRGHPRRLLGALAMAVTAGVGRLFDVAVT